jgi:hypothetical protein
MLACEAVAVALIGSWSSRRGWSPYHYLAIATGTVLTYTWVGLRAIIGGHTNVGAATGVVDDVGQVVLALLILGLIGWGVLRTRRAEPAAAVLPVSA